MYGNSNSDATINSQIIAYEVRGNGTADIHIEFQSADNYQATLPISIIPLK
jgi:hypothetical protein